MLTGWEHHTGLTTVDRVIYMCNRVLKDYNGNTYIEPSEIYSQQHEHVSACLWTCSKHVGLLKQNKPNSCQAFL